ncbi:MAG TPA: putative ABC exporter domain-containing protein [Gemmatimonadaceae bacterium]|nr:putative ABC exporter domain-containing protein [Gemmatimonadaceae bacterium]
MLEAFAYLFTTSLRNRMRRRLARLRSPRYALALCVGLAYIVLLLLRPSTLRSTAQPYAMDGIFALLSTVALAVIAAKWWLFGAPAGTLAFSPAEMQFLFPAPIRRRDLVLYRVLSTQFALLLSALFVGLILRSSVAGLPSPLRVLGLWVLFSTLFLHQMAVTLVRTGAAERGSGLRRNAPALVIVTTAVVLLAVSVGRAIPPVHGFAELPAALTAVEVALRGPIPSAVLAPFRWLLAPAYAPSAALWLKAIGPACAILVLHYLWVLRADATFQTAAVEASARRAARLAARAGGDTGAAARATPFTASRPWFPLAATGPAWMALVWKNTVALTRGLAIGLVVRMVLAIAVLAFSLRAAGVFGPMTPHSAATPATITAAIALIGAGYLSLLGPLAVRNDLRQDLAYLPVLRTFPLPGRAVLLAEILSPTLALSAVQFALLFGSYLLTLRTVVVDLSLTTRTLALAAACLVVPLLNATSFTIQNALALFFPAWSRLGVSIPTGFEMMGQRLLAAFAAMLALLLALVPPTVAGVTAAWLVAPSSPTLPTLGWVAAVVAALLTSAAELALACRWLGRVYDNTDVTVLSP